MKLDKFYTIEMTHEEYLKLMELLDCGDSMANELLLTEKSKAEKESISEEWDILSSPIRELFEKA